MRVPPSLHLLPAIALCILTPLAAGEPLPIDGRWVTFDDETKQKRSVVEIVSDGRRATGRIVELFGKPGEDPDPVCENCPGADRGRRIRGLAILSIEADAQGGSYRGTVLDPEEGRVYRCVATLLPGGKGLQLRGYAGIEFFGRNETWIRSD
jgi:uncharacterized protein (DUF2147 family)